MPPTTITWQDLDRDAAALRAVCTGIARLADRLEASRDHFGATRRGYFLPDEDDAVKGLFLAYRNYRIALYDIVTRHQEFATDPVSGRRLPRFLLAFGAAVQLYNWSAMLVHCYRDVPLVRAKLNEGDQAFGIEPGLFDSIHEALTRVDNLRRLHAATLYFLRQRRQFRDAVSALGPDWHWLFGEARRQYRWVRRSWRQMFADRWRELSDRLRQQATAPVQDLAYRFRVLIINLVGDIWFSTVPEIPAEHRRVFADLMEPGDFLAVRPDRKSSTVFLPGWWTHVAFYHGGPERLARFGLDHIESVRRHREQLGGEEPPAIVEAIAPGVVLNRLPVTLHVDHAVAIRPRLSPENRAAAVASAFANLGKEYDFELDFNRSDRMVCTEIISHALEGRDGIRFPHVQRFGRPTLAPDDVVRTTLAADSPFDILAISLKRPEGPVLLTGPDAARALGETLNH